MNKIGLMRKFSLYYHTVKYLKIKQVFYRLYYHFKKTEVQQTRAVLEERSSAWVAKTLFPQKLWADGRAVFLNEAGQIKTPDIWASSDRSLLWLYNLHYFEDLVAHDAEQRKELHRQLLMQWLQHNATSKSLGWHAYPLSLRVVNCLKAYMSGLQLPPEVVDSLAMQSDYLLRNTEKHILANHYFANGKALLFAGVCLQSKNAEQWRDLGFRIIDAELDEQILADGGNYELSPMYHSIMLVDLLDLFNLVQSYPNGFELGWIKKLKEKIVKMLNWLKVMMHDDGKISFFNDAAMGIAPEPATIFEYASDLGLALPDYHPERLRMLQASGYSRITQSRYYLLIDHAQVGPDYQPGHGHADSLSFEAGVGSHRLFVNSGVSQYGMGPLREYQRSSAAHNTVVVDSENSSEVWGGFRVARRANTIVHSVLDSDTEVALSCSHDGYKRLGGRVVHKRIYKAMEQKFEVHDTLDGRCSHAKAYFHLHPAVSVQSCHSDSVKLLMPDNSQVRVLFSAGRILVVESNWYPEFGVSKQSHTIIVEFAGTALQTTVYIGN